MTTQPEKKAALDGHIEHCERCAAAKKRVNDFCDLGRSLFSDWSALEAPIGVTVLDDPTSQRVIAEEAERGEKARWN